MKRSLLTTGAATLVLAAALPAGAAITGQFGRSDQPELSSLAESVAPAASTGEPEVARTQREPEPTTTTTLAPRTTEPSRPVEPDPAAAPAKPTTTRARASEPETPSEPVVRLECAPRVADGKAVAVCSWSEPRLEGVAGYRVWRLVEGVENRQVVGRTERREWVDKTVAVGTRYTYVVEVLTTGERSLGHSNAAAVAVPQPPVQTAIRLACVVKATDSNRGVLCEWGAFENPSVRAYQLWRSVNEAPRRLLITVGAADGARRYFDTDVKAGQVIVYRVIALDAAGNEIGASEIVRVGLPGEAPPPSRSEPTVTTVTRK